MKLPKGWDIYEFGKAVVFNPKVKFQRGERYPFIEMDDVSPTDKYVKQKESKEYTSGSCSKFKNNDVLFARITPCLDNKKIATASIGENQIGFGSTEFIILRERSGITIQEYVHYLSKSEYIIQNAINSYVGASGRQRADAKFIKKVKVPVPPIPEQEKIASLLSAYDDLIENNNKRISILEQTVEQIYKEWFVRMRFPGYEKTEFKKGIPKGWEWKPINEFSKKITRGIAPKYDDNAEFLAINQKCIRDGRIDLDLGRRQSKDFPIFKQILFGDVLINSTGEGTLGRIAQVYFDVTKTTVDTHVSIVRPNEKINIDCFGYCLLSLSNHFAYMAVGSTNQTELTRETIARTKILIPDIKIQNIFSKIVSPLRLETENLLKQIKMLKQTRDLLVPRLISGKLRVKELKEKIVVKKELQPV